ncbi:MAG: pilus assembly protein [Actinobacteria bacterium]|nr:pilus assembly protein [Actinomycetota bacterium]
MARKNERGANLVEFALLAPLLILLVFGIIEFSWVFAQNLNVRHGAREGARLAAVDFTPLISETCSRMDLVTGAEVTIAGTEINGTSGFGPGDEVAVTVDAPIQEITGLFTTLLPTNLDSTVAIRVEQPATWTNGTTSCP